MMLSHQSAALRYGPWLGLFIAVFVVWWPSLPASFQFDDWNVIVNEPRVHSLQAWWSSMPGMRPLLKLSYALNFSWHSTPDGFRLVNVTIHAINTLLVGLLFSRLAIDVLADQRSGFWVGWITALVFAFHPAQTEAVTYISGRSVSLSTLFSLLAVLAWDHPSHRGAWISSLCMVLAVACKETALALPLVFWLWSVFRPRTKEIRHFVFPVATCVILGAGIMLWPHYRQVLFYAYQQKSIADTLLTQPHAITYLVLQLIRVDHMNADPQVAAVQHGDWATVFLWILESGSLFVALRRLRVGSVVAFAVLWFFVWLAPVQTFLPRLDTANDRQLYAALIGPTLSFSVTLVRLQIPSALKAVVMLILSFALISATLSRNRDYQSEITFWEKTAYQNPGSSRAQNNLGVAYLESCDQARARQAFGRAVELDPKQYRARLNLYFSQNESGCTRQR